MSEDTQFKMPEPGPEHELLKPFEGTFAADVKIWMGPGEPVIEYNRVKKPGPLRVSLRKHLKLIGKKPWQNWIGAITDPAERRVEKRKRFLRPLVLRPKPKSTPKKRLIKKLKHLNWSKQPAGCWSPRAKKWLSWI